MTATLTRADGALSAPVTDAGRRGRSARRRVELRLAMRQSRRARSTSALVVALVAIPMMLISGGLTFVSSRTATVSQEITTELGQTAVWYSIVGGEDPSRWQVLDQPYDYQIDTDDEGVPRNPEQPPPSDLEGIVAENSLLEVTTTEAKAVSPGGSALLTAIVGDAADPLLDGRYELIDGRRPRSETEALVSPGAMQRLGAQLGDDLVLREPAMTLTIVGIMKESTVTDAEQTLFLPASAISTSDGDPLSTLWFAPTAQPTAGEVDELNYAGVVVYARDLVAAGRNGGYVDPSSAWALTAIALIVGAFTAYLVILLAGAGFAVSARRQERSLAVAASVGADRGSIFRIVVLQGTMLGLIGGLVGAALGIALAYPALLLFDDGAVSSFWGFHVPWWGLLGVVLFAVVVGTASALMPARAATRGDVLSSLRGSRKPAVVRVDRPFWGSLVIIVGLAATAAGGLGLAALNAAEQVDYNNPLRTLCVVAIVAGPILFQIGAILAGHWLLSLISRAASRAGLALRIAARDAAAHPSRIVPAFAAIAACVFIASFALTSVGVFTQQQARNWSYQGPEGSVVVSIWASEDSTIQERALDALEQTSPDAIGVVREDADNYDGTPSDRQDVVYPEVVDYTDCADVDHGACLDRASALFNGWLPAVVDPADLETVLGVPINEKARAAFAAGGALTLPVPDGSGVTSYLDGDAIIVHSWDPEDINKFWASYEGGTTALPEPVHTSRIPAQAVDLPHPLLWNVILSPAAADALDYRTSPVSLIGAFSTPPTQQSLDALAAAAGQQSQDGGFGYTYEQGPPAAAPWLWLILGAAGVLVLAAGGVALGLARVERRPDDATLAAVGASPGIRRRIAFWQAIIIVGIGSITGTVAGIIPMWGIVMQSQTGDAWELSMADTPWPWLALLAIGLPLAIAVVSWLVPTRRPDLTHRTAIA